MNLANDHPWKYTWPRWDEQAGLWQQGSLLVPFDADLLARPAVHEWDEDLVPCKAELGA